MKLRGSADAFVCGVLAGAVWLAASPAGAAPFGRRVVPRGNYGEAAKRWHAVAETEKPELDSGGRPMLVLHALNTGERIALPARGDDGGFDAFALDRAAHLLRDQRSGKEHPVHPGLLDLLYRAQRTFEAPLVRVISGYRAPGSKNKGTSNHGRGRATDVVIPGVADEKLAEWARGQAFLGVGIYPVGKFCHLDLRPQSYFWRDGSAPGRRSREVPLRGKAAATMDAAARGVGKRPFSGHALPSARVATAFQDPPPPTPADTDASPESQEAEDHLVDAAEERTLASLLAEERLAEAGELCLQQRDFARAVLYLERGALFARAAEVALLGGDAATALRLAGAVARVDLLERAAESIAGAEASKIADDLFSRRMPLAAAFAYRAAGAPGAAGRAFEEAGKALLAAGAYREADDLVSAARTLTARRRLEPGDMEAALALGEVLAAAGRDAQAARALQAIPAGTPFHEAALALLATLLERMGLPEARRSLGTIAPRELAGADLTDPRPLLFGRYEIVKALASSPTARVLSATDRLSGNLVVVKLLQASASSAGRDALARFEREARALTLLRHPHVLPLLAFHPEGPAAVFPFRPRGSLSALLEKGPLAPDHAAFVATALLDAVAAAHGAGVLHRDIKPSNVLFDGAMSPCLADFGAAHVGEADTTVTAGLIGSLDYMAPEQLAAEPATAATDIYAVGAVLYECLTGLPPRPADELQTRASDVYPNELGKAHDAVLHAMLARSPAERLGSAKEARDAIRALSWATRAVPRLPPRDLRPATVGNRLRPLPGDTYIDEMLRREVRLVPAALLPLARHLASRDLPGMEQPLRADPVTEAIWVEVAAGEAFDEATDVLSADQARKLRETIEALHAAGLTHGSLDLRGFVLGSEQCVWRFPLSVSVHSVEAERALLSQLLERWTQGRPPEADLA